jgi:hypothetical protein
MLFKLTLASAMLTGFSIPAFCIADEAPMPRSCPANIVCEYQSYHITQDKVMSSDGISGGKCSYFDEGVTCDSCDKKRSPHVFYNATTREFVGGAKGIVCPKLLPAD